MMLWISAIASKLNIMSRRCVASVLFLAVGSICQEDWYNGVFLPPLQGDTDIIFDNARDSTILDGNGLQFPNHGFALTSPVASVSKRQASATYICLPAGIPCPTNTNTIDLRIVTPHTNTNPCPEGQVACYDPTGKSLCGAQFVTPSDPAAPFAVEGEFPWQAYITITGAYVGSGVLIDPIHVLTVAHKVYLNRTTPGNIKVDLGVYDPAKTTNVQTRTVATVLIHPDYDNMTQFNDIAILRLNAPIAPYAQNINTACLPAADQSFITTNEETCTVSGWGQTAFRTYDAPTRMKKVSVPIVNYDTCLASMSQPAVLGSNANVFLDPAGEICAGGQDAMDACTQDGGAPLVCLVNGRYTVAGLVAWGKGCGQTGVYGVYVSLPPYITWIDSSISQLNG